MLMVDDDICLGCGACVDACPEGFEMRDRKSVVKDQNASCIDEAMSACPVGAIKSDTERDKIGQAQSTVSPVAPSGGGGGIGRGKSKGLGRGRWKRTQKRRWWRKEEVIGTSWAEKDDCVGCGLCIEECPLGMISMMDEKMEIIMDDRIRCGTCHDACPDTTNYQMSVRKGKI